MVLNFSSQEDPAVLNTCVPHSIISKIGKKKKRKKPRWIKAQGELDRHCIIVRYLNTLSLINHRFSRKTNLLKMQKK
jgi:hypothetical protein